MAVKDLIDKFTGDTLGREQQQFLRECSQFDSVRLDGYALAADYYAGKHKTQLLDRAKLILEANGIPYAENYCETVVDSMTHRMTVTGFEAKDDEAATEWANEFWELPANLTGEFQNIVHNNTTNKGDGFVAIEYSERLARPRMVWNRPELCEPHYADDSDEMEFLVKCWDTKQSAVTNKNGKPIRRMNIYYPDRIEKYFAVAQGENAIWSPHVDYADVAENGETTWPIWWTDTQTQDGAALGIPFVHFRNKANGNAFGVSEIRGAIPLQDAINKQLIDLFYVMDSQGWPQRHVSGVPDNVTLTVAVGEIIKATDHNAKFGQFDPADPRSLCEAIEASLRRFAIKTATPVGDLIASAAASGESKKMDNAQHVAKIDDRKESHGGAWSRVPSIAYKLTQTFGDLEQTTEQPQFTTIWDDSEPRNESAETEMYATQVRDLGLSQETALNRLGYDGAAEVEASRAQAQASALEFRRSFDRGDLAATGEND